MKRFLMLAGIFSLCGFLAGCGPESQEGLIKDTRGLMGQAASQIDIINNKVVDAMKKFEEGKTSKLDLSEAVKAAKQLKELGDKSSDIKRRIEQVRNTVTDSQKEEYAKNEKSMLAEDFQTVIKNQDKLRKSLDAAEKINKTEVDNFRKKLTEAEAAFPVDSRS